MPTVSPVVQVLVALVVGLSLQPLVLRLLTAAAVLDRPSERSSHSVLVPRGGGVAVVLAAAIALLLSQETRVVAIPLLLFAAIGLAEDVRGVPVRVRLALQALAGLATGLVLLAGGPPLGAATWIALVLAITVWLTTYTNAFNFMDGINGISATHGVIAGAVYALLGSLYNLPLLTAAGGVMAAASLTFLPWNAGHARIFLGDVGAYALGGTLGTLTVYALLQGLPPEAALAPLVLYLADTGWTLARRVLRGEAWYLPHRSHIYQRLTDSGCSHQQVTGATALTSTIAAACLLAAALSGPLVRIVLDTVSVAILAAYVSAPSWLHAARPHRLRPRERKIHV